MSNPTYRSIAKEAGVSLATVGYALRNSPEVSEETRHRIRDLAKSMGYLPDPILSAVMKRHRKRESHGKVRAILAFFMTRKFLENTHKTSLAADQVFSVESACQEEGFICERFFWEDFEKSPRSLFAALRTRNIPGVVFMYGFLPEWAGRLDGWKNYALAGIGGVPNIMDIHCSLANHHSNAWAMMSKMGELGYRKIGFALKHMSPHYQELSAYTGWMTLQELAGHSRSLTSSLHRNGLKGISTAKTRMPPPLLEWSESAFLRWLERHEPDALIVGEEEPIHFVEQAGLKIPKDIGVAHFCLDSAWRHRAGIRQNSIEEGRAAVSLVIEQINRGERGVPVHSRNILITGDWYAGPSVRKQSARSVSK